MSWMNEKHKEVVMAGLVEGKDFIRIYIDNIINIIYDDNIKYPSETILLYIYYKIEDSSISKNPLIFRNNLEELARVSKHLKMPFTRIKKANKQLIDLKLIKPIIKNGKKYLQTLTLEEIIGGY